MNRILSRLAASIEVVVDNNVNISMPPSSSSLLEVDDEDTAANMMMIEDEESISAHHHGSDGRVMIIFGILFVIVAFGAVQLFRIFRSSSGSFIVQRLEEKKKNEKVGTYSKYATEEERTGLDMAAIEFDSTEVMENNQYMSELTLDVVAVPVGQQQPGGRGPSSLTRINVDASILPLAASDDSVGNSLDYCTQEEPKRLIVQHFHNKMMTSLSATTATMITTEEEIREAVEEA